MTYKRFEDLPVWQEAIRLAHRVYDLTENPKFKIGFSLRDQIERSVMSISDNVAEGFERGTTKELLAFIYIARGSAGETRSKLCFMAEGSRFADFKSEISNLKLLAESCSRQLRGWAESLQDSTIEGQRHLNSKTRQAEAEQKKAAAFRKVLLSKLPPTHPLVREAQESGLM
jgi:four helix bundle protein